MSNNFVVNKAKHRGPHNKILYTITLVLLLTTTMAMASIQPAHAYVEEVDTYIHVMVTPNPVGVNQQIVITFQLDKVSPVALISSNLFQGFTLKITKPDGNVENKGPYSVWSMSGAFIQYVPTMVGEYTIQSSWPGQWTNTTTYQRYYKPSTSPIEKFTVQNDPILRMDNNPLPNDYWTRPINAENKGWYQISGNWLTKRNGFSVAPLRTTPAFAPSTSGPNSAHVLWKMPIWFGGIVGGEEYGDETFYTGLSYEQPYEPLIISGRIIYTEFPPTSVAASSALGARAVDLYTGKTIWYEENVTFAFGQILNFNSGNEHGAIAHLWRTSGSNWDMYDAFTGRYIMRIANVTTGSMVFGPNGEILNYQLTGPASARRLILWNSTKAIVNVNAEGLAEYYSPVRGSTLDGRRGIQWNVSLPAVAGSQAIRAINVKEGYILAEYVDETRWPNVYQHMAYPTEISRLSNGSYPDAISHLWIQNRTDIYNAFLSRYRNIQDGVYAFFSEDTVTVHAYSIKTGQELWVSEPLGTGWAMFSYQLLVAYGKVFLAGFDGKVHAFNATNGQLAWEYYSGNAGIETVYGTWPFMGGMTIADGKVYIANDEHSPDAVPWRGGKLHVIDVETGKGLWNLSGWLRLPAVADGYLTAENPLDGQVYVIGKGPSKTTVTAPDTAITLGSSIVVKGTVTDQSPGQKDTPLVSDESMGNWMEYLHMQKPFPTNAKGVEVTLTAIDPNGNYKDIGTVTSGLGGSFGYVWAPEIPGKYTIIAQFPGSKSYGSSYAETYIGVVEAPTPAPTSTATPTPTATPILTATPIPTASPSPAPNPTSGLTTETYVAIAAVVIIVAIAAIAVVLKRRK